MLAVVVSRWQGMGHFQSHRHADKDMPEPYMGRLGECYCTFTTCGTDKCPCFKAREHCTDKCHLTGCSSVQRWFVEEGEK